MTHEIGFLLKKIQENMDKHATRIFNPVDLTSSQFQVLKFVRGRGEEKTTQKEIELYLQVSHPTVVGIIRRLENKGFVRTEFDGKDKRDKYVYLTQKEEELFQQAEESKYEMEAILTKDLTKEQVQELRELLFLVYESVKLKA